jgi:type I restriction enzyme, S subunit
VKVEWKRQRLGDVATLSGRIGWRGLTAKEYTPEGPWFLSVHSLNYGDYVDFRDAFHISQARYEESPEIMLRPDDVLICKDGAGIGKLGIVGELSGPATINSSLLLIRAGEHLRPKFLYRYLCSPYFQQLVQSRLNGATTPHLYQRDITEFPVLIPPAREQDRIVAILDEAFEGIATAKANAEKNLQNARELFSSVLAKVFSADWPQVRIEDACQSIMDCVNKTAPTVAEATPYKMLRTTNVRNGVVSLASVNYVSEEVYKVWTRRQVPVRGDVILTREAPMGEVGMLESDELVFLGQRLVSYRAEPTKLDGRFLLYALQSEPLQQQIHALASGSTVQHMRVPDSKNLLVPLPGLQQQSDAVAVLDTMRQETAGLGAIYARKMVALDELKKSLLHQAFTGALTTKSTEKQLAAAA